MKTETAKEIFNKYCDNYSRNLCEEDAIAAMIEYAESKCANQRAICQQIFDLTDAQIGNVYKNAPTPKFS